MTRVWPSVQPAKLLERLFSSRPFLSKAADGVLSDEEQRAVRRGVRKEREPQRLPSALAALHDTARDLLDGDGTDAEFGHIVVDEAQDLSPMQLRMVARRARGRSITLLGDFAQRTVPTGNTSWESLVSAAAIDRCEVRTLDTSYRVPSDIPAFAAGLLPAEAPVPKGVRPADAPVRVLGVGSASYGQVLAALVGDEGTVGVVCSAGALEEAQAALASVVEAEAGRVVCLAAEECKGLEFSHVVVVDPRGIAGGGERGTGRLYTALTRAISTLTVLHAGDLPPELRDAPGVEYRAAPRVSA